jgi:hypothetical protein
MEGLTKDEALIYERVMKTLQTTHFHAANMSMWTRECRELVVSTHKYTKKPYIDVKLQFPEEWFRIQFNGDGIDMLTIAGPKGKELGKQWLWCPSLERDYPTEFPPGHLWRICNALRIAYGKNLDYLLTPD